MPFADNDGIRIFYEIAGAGRPMVLIHANPFDHNLWLYQSAHFSDYFRIVALDLRAYGRSDKPTTAYKFDDVLGDVLAVCRAEGIERTIVGGASIGSKIAFYMALERPGMVEASFHVGGNARRGTSYDGRITGYQTRELAAYRKEHMAELVAPGYGETLLGRHLLDGFLARSPVLSGKAIAQLFHTFDDVDLYSRIGDITQPTLIVNGEHDNSLPGARDTAQRIPDAVHHIIPNAGHVCCLEDPATFDALVLEFLARNGLMPDSVS